MPTEARLGAWLQLIRRLAFSEIGVQIVRKGGQPMSSTIPAVALSGAAPLSAKSEPTGSTRTPRRAARRRSMATAAALALAMTSESAIAQIAEPASSFSTGELLNACAADAGAEGPSAEFCEGFILGTGLFYLELRRAEKIEAWACADPAPDLQQIRRDFVAWARANPERLDDAAIDGFWRAMAQTYPCGSQ